MHAYYVCIYMHIFTVYIFLFKVLLAQSGHYTAHFPPTLGSSKQLTGDFRHSRSQESSVLFRGGLAVIRNLFWSCFEGGNKETKMNGWFLMRCGHSCLDVGLRRCLLMAGVAVVYTTVTPCQAKSNGKKNGDAKSEARRST